MTDNEIIKAFNSLLRERCDDCPFKTCYDCEMLVGRYALDLINRQQAEVERLTTLAELGKMRANDYRAMRNKAKNARAEAIKEFAERLNKEAEKVGIDPEGDFVETYDKIYDTVANWCKETSDNLVKEMVGDVE